MSNNKLDNSFEYLLAKVKFMSRSKTMILFVQCLSQ